MCSEFCQTKRPSKITKKYAKQEKQQNNGSQQNKLREVTLVQDSLLQFFKEISHNSVTVY